MLNNNQFNRPNQFNNFNQGHHMQQNVPRGTFFPGQGAFPQNMPGQHGMQNMRNTQAAHPGQMMVPPIQQNRQQMMPMPQRPPQMPMPQAPSQGMQMPPQHILNPKNDPNVRFEPVPEHLQPSSAPPQVSRPHNLQTNLQAPPQHQTPPNISEDLLAKFSGYIQGESNSMSFYDKLAKAHGISENEERNIQDFLNIKRQHFTKTSALYQSFSKGDWSSRDTQVMAMPDFKSGISYALRQESQLLREISEVYENFGDKDNAALLSIVHNKIADIAYLMAF